MALQPASKRFRETPWLMAAIEWDLRWLEFIVVEAARFGIGTLGKGTGIVLVISTAIAQKRLSCRLM